MSLLGDDIKKCNCHIASITLRLTELYIDEIRACTTHEQLEAKRNQIIEQLEINSMDDIPGKFGLEFFYQVDAIRQIRINK